MQIEVPAVKPSDLGLPPPIEGSAEVARRVLAARQVQRKRYAAIGNGRCRINALASGAVLEKVATPDGPGLALLGDAAEVMGLSARGYHRVLRVARTLADLESAASVARVHVAEALSYRQRLSGSRANV